MAILREADGGLSEKLIGRRKWRVEVRLACP